MALKILIADDEVDLVDACARFLEPRGYRCLKAYNATRAIELLAREEPDLMITDFQLPDRNGLEIAHHIHQTRPHVPVIMITAYDWPEMAAAAYEAGVSFYVPKPFTLSELARTANLALSGGRASAGAQRGPRS